MVLSDLLDRAALAAPESIFAAEPKLTYGEAARQSTNLSHAFSSKGLQTGERLMIITRNRVDIALAVFAAARLGAIFTVMHNAIKPFGLSQIVKQCTPALVLLDETTRSLAELFSPNQIVWCGDEEGPEGSARFRDLIDGPAQPIDMSAIDTDSPVCLVYTSGSTGAPRGVILSHNNITFVVGAIQARLQYRQEDVVGVFLPLSFDYGLYQIFLASQVGAALYIGRPESVGPEWIGILDRYRISVLPGVPMVFAALIKMASRKRPPLPALRVMTNTGDHLPIAYIEQVINLFPQVKVYPMYGLTECKRVSILLPEEIALKPGSVGRPLDGSTAWIRDENGNKLPPGQAGELVIHGPNVAYGYWMAEEETAKRFGPRDSEGNGTLYSGDSCTLDEDGHIYFVARQDSLIKNRGFRISPLEVENAVCSLEGISEAGVVKSAKDNLLHVFVTLKDPSWTETDILNSLKVMLEHFKLPDVVHIVASLPSTGNGKLDRKGLAATVG